MEKGSYSLVIELSRGAEVEVGSLGTTAFEPGVYIYNGSANGPGGFKRVERHISGPENIHWHIDHLMSLKEAEVVAAVRSFGTDAECEVSEALDFDCVEGFGCSDCGCRSHLFQAPGLETAIAALETAHREHTDRIEVRRLE